jgi:hypothetical protein
MMIRHFLFFLLLFFPGLCVHCFARASSSAHEIICDVDDEMDGIPGMTSGGMDA